MLVGQFVSRIAHKLLNRSASDLDGGCVSAHNKPHKLTSHCLHLKSLWNRKQSDVCFCIFISFLSSLLLFNGSWQIGHCNNTPSPPCANHRNTEFGVNVSLKGMAGWCWGAWLSQCFLVSPSVAGSCGSGRSSHPSWQFGKSATGLWSLSIVTSFL